MVAKNILLMAAAGCVLSVAGIAVAQSPSKAIILKPSAEAEAAEAAADEAAQAVAISDAVGEAAKSGHAESGADAQGATDAAQAGESHAEESHGDESHDSGGAHHYVAPKQNWSFNGIFGTYDRAAMQRGFQVYKEVCAACHSMSRLSYRNLADLGYSEGEIKAIAADVMVSDGPNEDGEMFERAGRASDPFKSPYPNAQAAKSVNNGAYPPDLSLLAKARQGGADYIYAILTGYEDAPANKELLPGQYWNKAMAGNVIAMPAPLMAGQVAYGDGTDQSVDQYSRDVSHFMMWAAEPKMESRKRTGVKVFLFLLVFTGVMYAVKRKIWSSVH
jgi:ubiquinol-cytochrome c reductase cytochrome c1 subunit